MTTARWRALGAVVGAALVLGLIGAVVVPRTLPDGEPPGGTATDDPGPEPGAGPSPPGTTPRARPSPSPARDGGILVMWARGGLPPETVVDAAALPGVEAAAFVRSGTLGLTGSRDVDGVEVDRLEGGRRIPVAATAVDPAAWQAVTGAPGDPGSSLAELRPGAVVLSRTGAELRGIGAGGAVDLDGLPGLQVVAVLPDEGVRGAELVLHPDDAGRAGLREAGSLVVRHDLPSPDAREELVAGLQALAPADTRSQVVPGDLAGYRAPLVLGLAEVKRTFGEFWYRPRPGEREVEIDPAFVASNIVDADVPVLGRVRCHRAIVPDLRAALQEIVDEGLAGDIDPSAYAGCHYARRIDVDRDALSRHSWGIALDINVDLSAPGLGEPPDARVVAAFGRHGFRWGGDFLQPDNHHFEWVGEGASERPTRSR